ncbi:hypothetical protein GCM10009554_38400 [Kribbella koreensis]|uniref:Uncharacterized protein n=2 Tax=Kribbella TaxID=182639 RepID=A0ABP6X6D4_9ACTN
MRRELSVPFEVRGQRGLINIRVLANDDPYASGHQLVVPGLDAESYRNFPICTATLRYHGQGINAIMGWIQLVTRSGVVTVDAPAFTADASPLSAYGFLPTFFDAPAHPEDPDGVWRADTFLVIVPDVIHTRAVEPVAAFTWGYRLHGGYADPLDPARRSADWQDHRATLAARYPYWMFL